MKKSEKAVSVIFSIVVLGLLVAITVYLVGTIKNDGNIIKSDTPFSNQSSSGSNTPSAALPEVDENLLTMDITFPSSYFQGVEDFDVESYVSQNGFIKGIKNSDGSLTVTMTKVKHKELLDQTKTSIEEGFKKMVGSSDYPFITEINHSENFQNITVSVDRGGYEADKLSAAMLPLGIATQVSFYPILAGSELHINIQLVDASTKEVLFNVTYPDDMG